ncbi:hypothetical protein [Mycolicibacterium komossense]|uniref:Secreted protein n=1 Tax=Mycolicibacterium komossense TaxID=1779 RepID=A0ABT3CKD1_9MYCO|nr:hypothetical protein [Mycolicibacterium komossense]MCV7230024.1 hypothetical protein [Mycolicibacterium komossense]
MDAPTIITITMATQIAVIAVAEAFETKIALAASPQKTPPTTAPTKVALCQSATGRVMSAAELFARLSSR